MKPSNLNVKGWWCDDSHSHIHGKKKKNPNSKKASRNSSASGGLAVQMWAIPHTYAYGVGVLISW